MGVEVGIYLDMRNPPGWQRPWAEHYEETLERVEEGERLGIGSVWLTEHHMWEDGYLPQPLVLAAAIASRTHRLRIGTGVMLAPLRPAIDIAEQAALVDILSDGRLELGLGAGYVASEFRAFGVDRSRRTRLLEERTLEVLRLWEEGSIAPPPVQSPPPIWIGALGPRLAAFAGRIGAGLLSTRPEMIDVYRQELLLAGHDLATERCAGSVPLVLADDPEAAWHRITPHMKWTAESYARAARDGGDPTLTAGYASTDVDPKDLRQRSGVPAPMSSRFDVVTPDEAIERLTPWLAERRLAHLFFWGSIAGMPSDLADRHVELVATKLTSALATLPPDVRSPSATN